MKIQKQNKGNVIEFNSCNMNELTYNSLSFNSSKFNSIGVDVRLNSDNEESEDVIATFDIFATYTVESVEERTTLLGDNFNLSSVNGMTIDGVDAKPTKKHKFTTTGEHIVKFSIVKNITSTAYMFSYCRNLTTLDLSNFDTSNITDMSYMFNVCDALTTLDVSNFDTSNVTDMNGMFDGCNNLTTLDLSNFDTSNVMDMKWMFSNSYNLTTLNPFKQWRKATELSFSVTKITPLAVHQLIERASNVADGAVARILKLSSTTKSNWEASEYYTADQAMATEKLITIQ